MPKLGNGTEVKDSEFYKEKNWFIIRPQVNGLVKDRFNLFWKEIESLLKDDSKESKYFSFLRIFQEIIIGIVRRDYLTIVQLANTIQIEKKLNIGCLEYYPKLEIEMIKIQVNGIEVEKLIEDVFNKISFAFQKLSQVLIPKLMELKLTEYNIDDNADSDKSERTIFVELIKECKTRVHKNKPSGYIVKQKDVYDLMPMPKSTFSERIKEYKIDFKSL